MEQPNMMPHAMAGGNNSNNNMNMAAMNSMQRPQSGNGGQQIHAGVMEKLRGNLSQLPAGWQQTFDIRERAGKIMQCVSQLRMLDGHLQRCVSTAENFEHKIMVASQNKDQYYAQWNRKLGEITQKRADRAAQEGLGGMPPNNNNNSNNNNNMGNMHNMNNMNMQGGGMHGMNGMNGMAGMGGMNMNYHGMGMNMPNGAGMGMPNPMNMGQQGFQQHLQRQMQPSPLPPQNPQHPQNASIDPSALMQNPAMGNHMLGQLGQPTPQQRQQQNMNPGQGGVAGPSQNEVRMVAKKMFDSTSEKQRNQLRAQVLESISEQQRQQLQAQAIDPLNKLFITRARENIIRQRQQMAAQQNGGGGMGPMGSNMQQTPSQPGQPNFDFSSLMGQQANAIKSQESGGEVVPASNNNSNNNNNNTGGNNNNNNSGNATQQGGNNQQQMMNNYTQNGASNPQGANGVQITAMQQERQRREAMMKKNQLAREQAIAQQNQLRGQPGGLNAPNALNGGQVNSPAMNMNMLNRPMVPPGQATPSTPHQNHPMQNHPPQTPSTGANQLAQHHQNMLSQNQNQVGQFDHLAPQQRHFLNTLAPDARAKLESLPPQQVTELLAKFANQRQGVMMPPGQAPGQHAGMSMGAQSMPNPNAMHAGVMGSGLPGYNSQPPPNPQQQHGPMGSGSGSEAGLQQKLHQQQQHQQLRQRAMDVRGFPKQALQSLHLSGALSPPDWINTWGLLKNHIAQNQSLLPQGLMERLTAMQKQWFDTHPEELKVAMQQFRQMMLAQRQGQGGQPQQQGGPQGMPVPNGQAPQAQMVAPPAQMQQPPPNPGADNLGVSTENIRMIREKMPQAKNMTDDQIRDLMRRRKMGPVAQANQDMQQNLRNAQMNAQMQRPQQMVPGGGAPTPQQPGQRAQYGPPPGQGQKRGNSDDVLEIPNPNAPPTQPPPQTPHDQQQRGLAQPLNIPGVKSREELMAMAPPAREAYMRKVQEMQALRKAQIDLGANAQQAQHAVPPPPPPPPAQQAQQAPSQQAQQAARSLQNAPQAVQQEMLRIRTIYAEEKNASAKGPQVHLDPRSAQQAQELLKKLWPIARTLDKTLIAGYRAFGEDKMREALKIKQIVLQNAADESGTIKDYLSVSLETLKRSEQFIVGYMMELQTRKPVQNGQDAGKQVSGQAPPAPPQHQPKPAQQQQQQQQQQQGKQPAPAAAATTGQAPPPLHRKTSTQHARKASQNKAPPAPTENKTFDWASPTPHAVPKYDPGRTELTADKLKFPPHKKRKTTDSQGSTPAAQTGTPGPAGASPQVAGGQKRESPDQPRKMPGPPPEPERPRFSCDDPFCHAASHGFDSEDLLAKHTDEEHRPVDHPFDFLMETVDHGLTAMGVDTDGEPLPVKPHAQAARRPPAAQKVADRRTAAAAALTPGRKAESATPATPASTGKAALKPGALTPAGTKAGEAPQPQDVEKTLYDSLVEHYGIEPPTTVPTQAAPPPTSAPPPPPPPAPHDPWLTHLAEALADADADPAANWHGGLLDDDWADLPLGDASVWDARPPADDPDPPSSPELTPASSTAATSSSSSSDISEAQRLRVVFAWDPAGGGGAATGDAAVVPEKLRRLDLGAAATTRPEDGGGGGGGEREEQEFGGQAEDKWNWDADLCDWDALFGAGSGLHGDDAGWKGVFGTERGF